MGNLDPTVVVSLVALVSAAIGALLTRGTEMRKLIAGAPTGYAQLVDDLQQERAELRTEVRTLADEVASMRTRMRGLETATDVDRRLIEALRGYVVELRSVMRRAGITPPPIPDGSGIEDSGPIPAVGP